MALADDTPAQALPGLPGTISNTLFGLGAGLWNLYGQISQARPAAAAPVSAPRSAYAPPRHRQDAGNVAHEAADEIHVSFHNTPDNVRVSGNVSGATLHIATGRGAPAQVKGALLAARSPSVAAPNAASRPAAAHQQQAPAPHAKAAGIPRPSAKQMANDFEKFRSDATGAILSSLKNDEPKSDGDAIDDFNSSPTGQYMLSQPPGSKAWSDFHKYEGDVAINPLPSPWDGAPQDEESLYGDLGYRRAPAKPPMKDLGHEKGHPIVVPPPSDPDNLKKPHRKPVVPKSPYDGARVGNLPATSTPNALDSAAGADAVFLSGANRGAPAPTVVPAALVPAKGGIKAISGEEKTISRPVTNFDIWAGKLHDLWYGYVARPEQFSPTRDKEMLDDISQRALQIVHDSHATGAPPTAVAASIMEELRQRPTLGKEIEEAYGDGLIHTQPRTIPRFGPPPPPLVSDAQRAERYYQEILPRAAAGQPIQAEKGESGIKKIFEQAGNPMKMDIGPGNINFGMACYNLNLYLAAHPHDDPLGLKKYKGNYPALWDDMTGPNAMTTAVKITAVHIGQVQDYYRKKDAAWYDSLSDAQKDIALEAGYRASRSALDVYFDRKNKDGLKPGDLVATKPHLNRGDWYDLFHDPRSPYFPAVKILKAPLAEGGDKG
jgi:hypothetical protein